MKRSLFPLLFLSCLFSGIHSAVAGFSPVINEIMASNDTVLSDSDGDYPDWIEIHNTGDTAGNLDGWFLTDDAANPTAWQFPATPLDPGEFVVVFASNKDRRTSGAELHTNFKLSSGGEYLALVQPDGTTIEMEFAPTFPPLGPDQSLALQGGTSSVVDADSDLFWHVPADGSLGTTWTENGFDHGLWAGPGKPAIGYEDTPGGPSSFEDLIVTNVPSGTNNLYIRIPFEVPDLGSVTALEIKARYDDAYIAYLNGAQIYNTPNAPASPVWNSNATSSHSDSLAVQFVNVDLSASIPELREGANVLAIHVINRRLSNPSTDFLFEPELVVTGAAPDPPQLIYAANPTPGSENSGAVTEIGPAISGVTDGVAELTPGTPLTISTTIAPAAGRNVATVDLIYRTDFANEQTLPMRDDGVAPDPIAGDGVYVATIPGGAATSGSMLRWAVLSTDNTGASSSAPPRLDPLAAEYFGTAVEDGVTTSGARRWRWWIEDENWYYTNGSTPIHKEYASCSVFFDGEFYDNVRVRTRGASSVLLNAPVQSFHYNFHSDHRLKYFPDSKRIDRINVNWMFVDQLYLRNQLSMEAFAAAGAPAPASELVVAHRNGSYLSVGNIIEHPDEGFLERHGLDPDGALYKVYNRLANANDRPEWTPGTSPNSLIGVEKKTRLGEDNSDLAAFIAGIDSSNPDRLEYVMDNLDIPAVLNFMAASAIDSAHDVFEKNNFVYRDTEGSGEWLILPWDRDVSWGQGVWNRNPIEWDNPQRSHPHYGSGVNGAATRDRYEIYEAVIDEPVLREMFERRLRSVLDQLLQAPGTPAGELLIEARIAELITSLDRVDPPGGEATNYIQHDKDLYGKLRGEPHQPGYSATSALQTLTIATAAVVDTYLPNRRTYLYDTMGTGGAGIVPEAQVGNPAITFGAVEYNPSSGNQDEEYIEIVNSNPFAVDISGWTISGGVDHTFRPGTVIPSDGELYLSPDVVAFRARATSPTGGEGRFVQGNYSGHISNFGETLELRAADTTLIDSLTTPSNPSAAQQFLVVTEIMYHPAGDGLAEYIELTNIGPSALDLTGVKFSDGIRFDFPGSLASGARTLVVRDLATFEATYGTGLPVAGVFTTPSALDNSGETIKLDDATNSTISEFRYDDKLPWPVDADGNGFSIVLIDPGLNPDPNIGSNWRSSAAAGGSPGGSDATTFSGDPDGDDDGDGISNFLQYASVGTGNRYEPPRVSVEPIDLGDGNPVEFPVFAFHRHLAADDVIYTVEMSTDLADWTPVGASAHLSETNQGNGTSLVRFRSSIPQSGTSRQFMRLSVRAR